MTWQWDQITAMSLVIGIVSGLISVYFVILEIRRTAQATEGATVQSLMSLEKDVFSLLSNNEALCLRGNARASKLSPAEMFRYERLVALQMSMYYSAFVQYGQGLIDEEVWEAYFEALKTQLSKPGFRQTWKGMEKRYPKSFRAITGRG